MAVLDTMPIFSYIWKKLAGIHLTIVLCLLLAADLSFGYVCLNRNEILFAPLNDVGLIAWINTYGRCNLKSTAWLLALLVLLTLFCINTFVCTTDRVARLIRHRKKYPRLRLLFRLAPHLMHYALILILTGYLSSYTFARVLAQEPRLLLLDEPTLHLDLKHRMEVINILRNLCHSRGITVVASLHDVDYYVARCLGADCMTQMSMTWVSSETLAEAGKKLNACELVIDCGFDNGHGPISQGNRKVLQMALRKGKRVMSLRVNGIEKTDPDLSATDRPIICRDAAELLEAKGCAGYGFTT